MKKIESQSSYTDLFGMGSVKVTQNKEGTKLVLELDKEKK